jgi:hypothetical protein
MGIAVKQMSDQDLQIQRLNPAESVAPRSHDEDQDEDADEEHVKAVIQMW